MSRSCHPTSPGLAGKIVKRYGVKIRFKGHGLRIGSAYCTPEDASTVASAFRRVAQIDDFGNIQFDALLYSTYKNVYVNIYLPFTTTIDSISVCDLLTKWLNEIKKKPVQQRKIKKRFQRRKNRLIWNTRLVKV